MAPAPTKTYRIATLGCKANVYDSRRLAEALETLGYREARDGRPAAVCIVNTCTVTAVADRKSRQRAARLAREHPGARVFVTGCYAQSRPGEVTAVPGVTGVYGRAEWPSLLEAINGGPLPPALAGFSGDFGVRSFGGRARAFLKVQEGCDSSCSYCILPQVRGNPRSRPLQEIREEACRLAAAGFAEVVLTGIHIGLYGLDLDDQPSLARVLRAVAQTQGIERVRLSSIEVNEVDDEFLEAMQHPAVCAHLHIPLQSGDADVLNRMNRPYTPGEFLDAVQRARARLDRPAITTDVMVGFPGETDEQFERTTAVCREAEFSRIHVFPFSPRPGTPAAEMMQQVPSMAVRGRSQRLRALAAELAGAWAASFVGSRAHVLFERRTGSGRLAGYTDRYVRLTAAGGPDLVGRVVEVVCTARQGTTLVGSVSG
ncbi:MAG: tRNA (N(6)-L-threonylcarbamoyladenosine(37)-C(2))-methylthiotransferase MtaB [Planctomycetota bacterium]|jgi:threonylcarbamoyladenosine tRNA methylthiotransferase MtaB